MLDQSVNSSKQDMRASEYASAKGMSDDIIAECKAIEHVAEKAINDKIKTAQEYNRVNKIDVHAEDVKYLEARGLNTPKPGTSALTAARRLYEGLTTGTWRNKKGVIVEQLVVRAPRAIGGTLNAIGFFQTIFQAWDLADQKKVHDTVREELDSGDNVIEHDGVRYIRGNPNGT